MLLYCYPPSLHLSLHGIEHITFMEMYLLHNRRSSHIWECWYRLRAIEHTNECVTVSNTVGVIWSQAHSVDQHIHDVIRHCTRLRVFYCCYTTVLQGQEINAQIVYNACFLILAVSFAKKGLLAA